MAVVRFVVVGGCIFVLGAILGAFLISQSSIQQYGRNTLYRVRRSIITLLPDETENHAGPSEFAATVYTIWGRTECPKQTERVYKGIVGGSFYNHPGGSSDYTCLVEKPVWNKTIPGMQTNALIYGAEFKAGDGLFDLKNIKGPKLLNQDAVCAVCVSPRSVQVMIPGTNICMKGWHREYYGYLMSSKWDAATQTQYICVDIAPEAVPGGSAEKRGAHLYPVEAACGYSLPCPNYEAGKELTCVVCSQ